MRSLRPGLLPVIALVAVLAFAVFAVAMLLGTLLAANRISSSVGVITPTYGQIGQDTRAIELARTTAPLTEKINKAVQPLGPGFSQTLAAAGGIKASAASILDRARQINGTVHLINTTVHSIGGRVDAIGVALAAVDGKVGSIRDSARGIDDSFADILEHAISIDPEAKGINVRALRVRDRVRDRIRPDLRRLVHTLVPDIRRNAGAIARSPILNPLDIVRDPNRVLWQALHEPELIAKGAPFLASHPQAAIPQAGNPLTTLRNDARSLKDPNPGPLGHSGPLGH